MCMSESQCSQLCGRAVKVHIDLLDRSANTSQENPVTWQKKNKATNVPRVEALPQEIDDDISSALGNGV
jgi:hypothetical protein